MSDYPTGFHFFRKIKHKPFVRKVMGNSFV